MGDDMAPRPDFGPTTPEARAFAFDSAALSHASDRYAVRTAGEGDMRFCEIERDPQSLDYGKLLP